MIGHFLWRLRKKNNRDLIAVSAQGYDSRAECEPHMMLVMSTTTEAPWIDLTEPPTVSS